MCLINYIKIGNIETNVFNKIDLKVSLSSDLEFHNCP